MFTENCPRESGFTRGVEVDDQSFRLGDHKRFIARKAMERLIEQLDFGARRWCIHFPPPHDYDATTQSLVDACKRAGKSLAVAKLPDTKSFRFRLGRRPSIFDWFCAATGSTLKDAKRIVAAMPVSIHPDFRCNAMNPMRFLGLATAIAERPDVLIYETSGMDPLGIKKIHSYAREQYSQGCLIHVCWHANTDMCPNASDCSIIKSDSGNAK